MTCNSETYAWTQGQTLPDERTNAMTKIRTTLFLLGAFAFSACTSHETVYTAPPATSTTTTVKRTTVTQPVVPSTTTTTHTTVTPSY